MKYKIGDKVAIRKDLKTGVLYGDDYIDKEMLKTPIVTIKDIVTGDGNDYYLVEENKYSYNDEMFDYKIVDTDDKINSYTNNPVSHPSYYTDGKIEVIDFIEDKKLGFHLGNVVKYVARAGKKNPDKYYEDLKKAAWYLNREIEKGNKND